ncbi:hypothetical protein D5266_02685 [bacterium c-19]|nr:hypothetical protein [bacterium c-19]
MITYIEDHINEIVIHMETRGTYTIKERCKVFLNKLCEHYGSSYEGRIQAICACLNIHQKAPVLIREGMILYPLADALTKNNVWVNYCMVKKITAKQYQTLLEFHDGTLLLSDSEYRTVKMQQNRCKSYLFVLNETYTPFSMIH